MHCTPNSTRDDCCAPLVCEYDLVFGDHRCISPTIMCAPEGAEGAEGAATADRGAAAYTGSLPATMRAVLATKASADADFSNLRYVTDQPVPAPGIGEVVIAVAASSVNPVDWKITDPGGVVGLVFKYPHVLGFDVAGVVAAVGKGCKRLKVGDAVWADLGQVWPLRGGQLGAYAEYALADEKQVGRSPTSIGHAEAAALPLVALTSYQALVKAGAPWAAQQQRGDLTVMVTSGSGGTGFVATQMAKHAWNATTVITVCGTANAAFCAANGADVVHTYDNATGADPFALIPADSVDVVYDNFGAPGTADKAMAVLRSGGVYIFLPGKNGGVSKHPKAGVKQINYGDCDSSKHEDLDAIAAMVDAGFVRSHVQRSFALADIVNAFNVSYGGQVVGKLGVTI